jgi:AGZA family xanthine/uracil permease-like MFS transporter
MARPLQSSPAHSYRWASWGDLNAFFGLMLDNVANLVLTVSLLATVYRFPPNFALHYMIPGTAAGVLVGDLIYTWMAFRLARRTGRQDVTAMPLGLDTPSTFGMVFFVLGPAYLAAQGRGLSTQQAAHFAWQIGICATLTSGTFKLLCALGAGWIRRAVPRAGLLGSLAAIALVLISFLPLLEIMRYPLVGLLSLVVILTTLVARVELPWRIPGALGALLVGGGLYYGLRLFGAVEAEPLHFSPREALLPVGWLEAWRGGWLAAWGESLRYLPVVLPFALGTVVGGIDCTESAAAAGDEYHTGRIVAVEGLATVLAALCGGVIQTTPYIGHPAYKAMGGRAAYTLATALFVGGAGILGYFAYMYLAIPKAAIYPMLVFIGLEISSQSFHATPARHYAAVAMACIPAMAYLVAAFADRLLAAAGTEIPGLVDRLLAHDLQTIRMLSGGFIITSLLWSSALANIIDRRLLPAAGFLLAAAACSLVGIIHSPYQGSPLALPWRLPQPLPTEAEAQSPWILAASYAAMALLLAAWHIGLTARGARPKL